jgi:hypothetical protein
MRRQPWLPRTKAGGLGVRTKSWSSGQQNWAATFRFFLPMVRLFAEGEENN